MSERKKWRRLQPRGWYRVEGGWVHYVQEGWVKTACGRWVVPRQIKESVSPDPTSKMQCLECFQAMNSEAKPAALD